MKHSSVFAAMTTSIQNMLQAPKTYKDKGLVHHTRMNSYINSIHNAIHKKQQANIQRRNASRWCN